MNDDPCNRMGKKILLPELLTALAILANGGDADVYTQISNFERSMALLA